MRMNYDVSIGAAAMYPGVHRNFRRKACFTLQFLSFEVDGENILGPHLSWYAADHRGDEHEACFAWNSHTDMAEGPDETEPSEVSITIRQILTRVLMDHLALSPRVRIRNEIT